MLARNEILQGRYRIARQLGHGGMGAVYEAIDERFGESVALKEIITDNLPGEGYKEMFIRAFEREAKALAKARHESVPYVRDYFSELGRQFLVMELIEGPDLAEMLEKRQSPFPVEEVLGWLDQLLDALDYLHTLQPPIIHRDIKPQNLKLNARRRIKLLDFGISKSVDASSTITHQTFIGATINYSPIEQILPAITQTFREFIILKHEQKARYVLSQNTDARCDIYAVGATVYHLLTNRPPVDAAKRSLEMWEGSPDPLDNPSQLNPEIPPAISEFLLKAMEVERDRRYSSAVEMRKALHLVVNEEIRRKREAEASYRQAEQEHLRLAAEAERKRREQSAPPSQIETEVYISGNQYSETAADEFAETIKDISAHIQQLPTEVYHLPPTPPPPKEAPPVKAYDTDPSLKTAADTNPAGGISEIELTAVSHLAEILGETEEQRETAPEPPPIPAPVGTASPTPVAVAPAPRKNAIPLWILPFAAFAFLGVGGLTIGGIIWLSSGETDPDPPTNVRYTTPEATPENTPVETPTPVAASPTPTPTPFEEQTYPVENNVKPESSVTPTVQTPAPTPVKTVVPKTPTPGRTPQKKPTPKKPDPNCIYNNSC